SSTAFDALNRPKEITAPDSSIIRPIYNEANLLDQIWVKLQGASAATPFITNIEYNAKGQRTLVEYGNGACTALSYDPLIFRLEKQRTVRPVDGTLLQHFTYTYDAAGHLSAITDGAQQTVFFKNQRVSASNDYVFDAIYRLVQASGREHIGLFKYPQVTH